MLREQAVAAGRQGDAAEAASAHRFVRSWLTFPRELWSLILGPLARHLWRPTSPMRGQLRIELYRPGGGIGLAMSQPGLRRERRSGPLFSLELPTGSCVSGFSEPPPARGPSRPSRSIRRLDRAAAGLAAGGGGQRTAPGALGAGKVYVDYVDAYPEGFELEIRASTSVAYHELGREDDGSGPGVFGRRWPIVGERRDVLPPQLLRIGVQFADGRAATNIGGHDRPVGGPVMWPLRGGGRGGREESRFQQGYWVSPLPPPGPVGAVCEWPAVEIPVARQEIDAQLIRDAAENAQAMCSLMGITSSGTDARGASGRTTMRRGSTTGRRRWLGYLDTGASDVVFPYAPRTAVYYGYGYVLVEAGRQQAARWREKGFNWTLPGLMFPADRSWLVSTMWDDGWTSIGGLQQLVDGFLSDTTLGPRARRVALGQDSTPPGHGAN